MFSRLICVTGMLMLDWLVSCSPLCGKQLIVDSETMERVVPFFVQNADGSLKRKMVTVAGVNPYFVEIEVLRSDPSIEKSLELSAEQKSKLAKLRKAYEDSRLMMDEEKLTYSESNVAECALWLKGWRLELSEILNEQQLGSLDKCYRRFLLRTFGLSAFLGQSKLRKSLELPQDKLDHLVKILREQQLELDALGDRHRSTISRELFSALTNEQRSFFDEKCGELYSEMRPPLEVIVSQHQRQVHGNLDGLKDDPSVLLSQSTSFELMPSGGLVPSKAAWDGPGSAKLNFLLDTSVSRRLDISDSQLNELREVLEWSRQERSRVHAAEFGRLYVMRDRHNMSLEERKKDGQALRDARRAFESEFGGPIDQTVEKRVSEILVPRQQQLYAEVLFNVELRVLGLANSLVFGSLGRELKISNRQRGTIERIRDEFKDVILADLMDFEKRTLAKLQNELNPDHGEAWRELTGEMPPGSQAAPTLLLMSDQGR